MSSMKREPRKPRGQTPVRDWYTLPEAEHIARRREVWGLLRWYHHTWVVPNRGVRGVLRRIWWRLTGQRRKLLSPWEQLDLAIAAQLAATQAAQATVAQVGATDLPPEEGNGRIQVVDR